MFVLYLLQKLTKETETNLQHSKVRTKHILIQKWIRFAVGRPMLFATLAITSYQIGIPAEFHFDFSSFPQFGGANKIMSTIATSACPTLMA